MSNSFRLKFSDLLAVNFDSHCVAFDLYRQIMPFINGEIDFGRLFLAAKQLLQLRSNFVGLSCSAMFKFHWASFQVTDFDAFGSDSGDADVTGMDRFLFHVRNVDAQIVFCAQLKSKLNGCIFEGNFDLSWAQKTIWASTLRT